MDYLDMLTQGDPQNSAYMNGAAAGAPAPTPGAPGPNILDILAKVQGQPLPAVPKPDEQEQSMLGPLALLQFAMAATRPRAYGQSTGNALLEAGGGAVNSYMENKRQLEDRTVKQAMEQRQLAKADSDLQNSRLETVAGAQKLDQASKKAPMELESMRAAIDKSKSEQELAGLQIRAAKLKERYAEKEIQAGLDEKAAKTDEQRAQAAMERSHAALFQKQADELVAQIAAKKDAANKPSYALKDSLPGEPTRLINTRTGDLYTPPMEPADALEHAKRQIKAMKEAGELKGKDEAVETQRLYQQYKKGNVPSTAAGAAPSDSSAPATPPGVPAGAVNVTPKSATEALALAKSSSQPVLDDATNMVHMPDGRTIPYADYKVLAAQRGAKPAAGPAAAAPVAAAPAITAGPDKSVMQARVVQEDAEIAKGTRTDYSPEVKAWIGTNRLRPSGNVGKDAYEASQRANAARARELARGQ